MTFEELKELEQNTELFFVSTFNDIYKVKFSKLKKNKVYLIFDGKYYPYEAPLCSEFLFKRKDEAIVHIYNKTKNKNVLMDYKDELIRYPELFV